MKIGILGAGRVGSTLGRRLGEAGHLVIYGVRDPTESRHEALRVGSAEVARVPDAAARADVAILATPWAAAQAVVEAAGDFAGKPLLDATNPIGPRLSLTHGHDDSGAEQVARWAQGAKVVKVFNTTGLENMENPQYGDARATMFVCGDDRAACDVARGLAEDVGFEAIVVGNLDRARVLEPLAILWIQLAAKLGTRDVALALLRR